MPDIFNESESHEIPEDICRAAFSRCSNWPQDRAGQLGLAQGLLRASTASGIPQGSIVVACSAVSAFCPTDADLMRVAMEMKAEEDRKAKVLPPWKRRQTCEECGGTGWKSFTRGIYDYAMRCPRGCIVPDQQRFGDQI